MMGSNGYTPQDDETREMFNAACARISDNEDVQMAQLAKDEAEFRPSPQKPGSDDAVEAISDALDGIALALAAVKRFTAAYRQKDKASKPRGRSWKMENKCECGCGFSKHGELTRIGRFGCRNCETCLTFRPTDTNTAPEPHSPQPETRHEWWVWRNIECCKQCGVVRRADGTESLCKGKVAITLRFTGKGQMPPLDDEVTCGHACGVQEPYGFVPEADCPVHDPDTTQLRAKLADLEAKLSLARAGLEWYADNSVWYASDFESNADKTECRYNPDGNFSTNGFSHAQQTLRDLDGEK